MKVDSDSSLLDLIVKPILTEKATFQLEQDKYIFDVDRRATKSQVKEAIETFFEVTVLSVNTSRRPPKRKRVGRFIGYKPNYKRAVVTLAPGNKIELFPEL